MFPLEVGSMSMRNIGETLCAKHRGRPISKKGLTGLVMSGELASEKRESGEKQLLKDERLLTKLQC